MKKKIAILGSTGSVGTSCLDICRQHPDRFEVVSLAAGRNTDVLVAQIREFKPGLVSVLDEKSAALIRSRVPANIRVVSGVEGAVEVATIPEAGLVISAIVGAAGLLPTMRAIEAGKTIALANKESMVVAGSLMSGLARRHEVKILPVDSEHSAIFQCLNGEHRDDVQKLVLTASGGPFLNLPAEDFRHITKAQALKHPNWDMGAKITIDSATMMNKGLEVIEAHYLFDVPVEKIDVNIHPQSVIHSMVEFVDGSVMAQLGEPDMRGPIAYALSYPRRITTGAKRLNLPDRQSLTFFRPDFVKFPCLKLAFEVARLGQSLAPVLNAANEIAVAEFLNDRIHFTAIPKVVEKTLESHQVFPLQSIGDVLEADRWARQKALEMTKQIS